MMIGSSMKTPILRLTLAAALCCLVGMVASGCSGTVRIPDSNALSSGYLQASAAGEWALFENATDAASENPRILAILKPGEYSDAEIAAHQRRMVTVVGRVEGEAGEDAPRVLLVDAITDQSP
jgi:hypothetical protein